MKGGVGTAVESPISSSGPRRRSHAEPAHLAGTRLRPKRCCSRSDD